MRRRLINAHPTRGVAVFLAALPFLLLLFAYVVGSEARLAENPNDKLLPSFSSIGQGFARMAFEADARTGDVLLWVDTAASLARLMAGLAIATLLAGTLGVAIGLLPYMRASFNSFVAVLAMIPPLAILPILFIIFGLGETSKIALIVIGVAPVIMRDMILRVEELPRELMVKAQTLGASTWQIALRVVVPQMLPRLIDSVRLSLCSAWLFLIAAEAIASQSGLGYRIFLLRRYLAMDTILPYVAWITLLAFLLDFGLRKLQDRAFPWFAEGRKQR
ncbi:ABC transporter permease [Iodidimonas sp. SYSU 1G8]|uniref:ABC transporter permease n=1 Tax=Iodidimonas sp. SYSU 1G8 TaxID=3133967 RepID=UPI0031FF1C1E